MHGPSCEPASASALFPHDADALRRNKPRCSNTTVSALLCSTAVDGEIVQNSHFSFYQTPPPPPLPSPMKNKRKEPGIKDPVNLLQ